MITLAVDFDKDHQKQSLYNTLKHLKGLQVVTIKKFRKKRSSQENKYYWGVVVKILSDEFGYLPDEMHDVLKRLFLAYEKPNQITGEVERFAKSTTGLTTEQAEQYYENIRIWALTEYSILIPLPNENL
jgi:hypothetical protein